MIYGNSRKLTTLSMTKQRVFDFLSSNKINSVLLIDEAVRTTRNCQMGWCVYVQRVIWVCFLVGQCVQILWVVGGGGLYGYLRERGLLFGVQESLERFHRPCVDYLRG